MASLSTQCPTVLHTKHAAESRVFAFDFSLQPEIVALQTLTTPVLVSYTPNDNTLTLGPPTISSNQVQFNISAGTPGITYSIVGTVNTNTGATLQACGSLQICSC